MYNPLYGMLFRLLGQAAVRGFTSGGGAGDPFGAYGAGGANGAQDDDSPIDVEAEVVDDDGKTQAQKAHEEWDAQRKATASGQLGGHVVFEGSRNYNILIAVLCVLLLLGGVVVRIYSLVMGSIFSSVVVPVALGALFGLAVIAVGVALIWRRGAWKMPFCGADLLLVFFSAAVMGYGNIVPTVVALLCCWGYMKLRDGKKLPFAAVFALVAVVEGIAFGFPGLWFG